MQHPICQPKELKIIKRVNIRLKVDNTLRYVNDSAAIPHSALNNVSFVVNGILFLF